MILYEDNELDAYIKKFHEVEREEIDLFLNFKHDAKWPDPPSSRLWFDGIKMFGNQLIDREYELRNNS